jgi:hypothetical protein
MADDPQTLPDVALPDVLYALLYDHRFRATFVSDGPAAAELRLPANRIADLQAVDLDELCRTTARIRSMVLRGHVGEHSGLQGSFPLVLRLLEGAGLGPVRVCEAFIASPQFMEFREVPYGGRGVTMEEAFHTYLQSQRVVAEDPLVGFAADHELLSSLMRTLATGGAWTFDVRAPLVSYTGLAWYAVLDHDPEITRKIFESPTSGLYLYAASASGMVCGPCPGWLEPVLAGRAEADQARLRKLVALGLLPPSASDRREECE